MEFYFRETEGENVETTELHLHVVPQRSSSLLNNEEVRELRSVRDLITTLQQQQQNAHHHPVKVLHLHQIQHFGEDLLCIFANNECPAALTTVFLYDLEAEISPLSQAFHTNKPVKVLKFIGFRSLQGIAFGDALSSLLLRNTTVQGLNAVNVGYEDLKQSVHCNLVFVPTAF
jgi:hypothetical protein